MQELEIRAPTVAPELPADLDEAFARLLRVDVAQGDASADTLRGYRAQVRAWGEWCWRKNVDPAKATVEDVKQYRRELVDAGAAPATVAHKLTILRRFYEAAKQNGLRPDNPVAGVKPPRQKRAAEDFGYLGEVELVLLVRQVQKTRGIKGLRDRALVGLLALQGLRTVEVQRANVEDLQERGEAVVLLVRGKGRDRLSYLRPDVAEVLAEYLRQRGPVTTDETGTPLLAAVGNRAGGTRLSRRGIRKVVDEYLDAADLKRPGVSGHALRHTFATLAYKKTNDLRAVQDALGHADPKTTARYAHVVDAQENNPAVAINSVTI